MKKRCCCCCFSCYYVFFHFSHAETPPFTRYEQALNVIERHEFFLRSEGANHALHKLFVTSTLVMLAMGDFVRADKTYKVGAFCLNAPSCRYTHCGVVCAFCIKICVSLSTGRAHPGYSLLDYSRMCIGG